MLYVYSYLHIEKNPGQLSLSYLFVYLFIYVTQCCYFFVSAMAPSRGPLPAQRHFLMLLAFTTVMMFLLNLYGPPSLPAPPPPSLSRTYLTSDCEDGRRLGNLMFNYASMVGIANTHNMTIVMRPEFRLFDIFHISALSSDHMENTLGLHNDYEEYGRRACAYDIGIRKLEPINTRLHGYFQSWKYFNHSRERVKREFRFKDHIAKPAREFIERSIQSRNFKQTPVVVGIHVRRGDYLEPYFSNYGYSTADKEYFTKAMQYFTSKYSDVLFLVCSDDIAWCQDNIQGDNVVYSHSGSDVIDLAILSQCTHSIMSTGSFGWWGAWLTNGTTIYYSKWPKPVSVLEYMVTKHDFFYPHWIPLP